MANQIISHQYYSFVCLSIAVAIVSFLSAPILVHLNALMTLVVAEGVAHRIANVLPLIVVFQITGKV